MSNCPVIDCGGNCFHSISRCLSDRFAGVIGDHLGALPVAVSLLLSVQPAVLTSQQSGPAMQPVHEPQLLRYIALGLTNQSM